MAQVGARGVETDRGLNRVLERHDWNEVDRLFEEALALAPTERETFLVNNAPDAEIRGALAELLAYAEEPDSGLVPGGAVAGGLGEALLVDLAGPDDREPGRAGGGRVPGDAIGPYRLVREIGAGGMGVVYEARDERLGRAVAIKFLDSRLAAHEQARERFLREARAAAALHHPNICTLHDIGETEEGAPYLVMALCRGETLGERLAQGPLDVGEALELGLQVARGLECAHAAGVVHRDIKPSNIMVASGGEAIILDFGIAAIEGEPGLTQAGMRVGTPQFMSPEQRKGGPVDARTDLWSLAAVLWEMLTGEPVVDHTPTPEVLRGLRPEIPLAVARLVVKGLAAQPADRHAAATELAAALEAARNGALGSSGSDSSSGTTGPDLAESVIPVPPSPLRGRERELESALRLLERVRLLTLTGPGGVGKTRLALALAERLQATGRHVAYVDLTPLRDPDLVVPSIAQRLGLPLTRSADPLAVLAADLRRRRLVLVLDNFEHVVAAAPAVATLLAAVAGLVVLVTSRIRLRLGGEHLLTVPPLEVPAAAAVLVPEALESCPAVALLLERARSLEPGLQLDETNADAVASICRRLEGLPLALELAAPWLRIFSPAALLERLESRLAMLESRQQDLPERHLALRAAIAWSDELLGEADRTLFRRLAVFDGGFTLAAATAVAATSGVRDEEVAAGVASLLDQSLLTRSGHDPPGTEAYDAGSDARFGMLESVREYGLERLRRAGEEDEIRKRHARVFLTLSEAARTSGREQAQWLATLSREHDNLRAAVSWTLAAGESDLALRFGAALWRFWLSQGHAAEGVGLLQQILAAAEPAAATETLARTWHGFGYLAVFQGRNPEARAAFERALALRQQLGDEAGIARELTHLAVAVNELGEMDRAEPLAEEALALCRRLGDAAGEATALTVLGWIAVFRGRYEEARSRYRLSLAGRRRVGDDRNTAFTLACLAWAEVELGNLDEGKDCVGEARALLGTVRDPALRSFSRAISGYLAYLDGDVTHAMSELETSVRRLRRVDSGALTVWAREALAAALIAEGKLDRAAEVYRETAEWARPASARWALARARTGLARLELLAGDVAEAERLFRKTLVLRHAANDHGGTASCLEGLAAAALGAGDERRAARLLAAAEAWRLAQQAPVPIYERRTYETLRHLLEPARFRAEWAAGLGMSPLDAADS